LPRSRRQVWIVALLFLAALGVRLAYLADVADHPAFGTPIVDASFYDLAARTLAAGGEAAPRLFWQPYLYPRLLATVYAAGGSILTVKVLQAVLGALTAVGTFLFGRRRLGFGPGLAAGGMVAFYGPLVLFEGELLAAGVAAFEAVALLLLLEWAGARLRPASGIFRAAGIGVAIGLAAAVAGLTRPTFLPFLAVAVGWLAVRTFRGTERNTEPRRVAWRRTVAVTAAAAVAFVAVVLPVAFAAERVTGSFSFLPGSGALNLYIGNSEELCETLTVRPGAEWGELLALPERHGASGYSQRQRFYRERVVDLARDRPGVFLGNLGAKALRFVGSRELPRNLDVYVWREWSGWLSILTWKVGRFGFPFGVLLPLAVLGVVWNRRRLGTPLLLFLTLYPLAVIAVFVSARYRVPLVPALAVAAAAGGAALVEAVRERRRRRLGGMAAVGVVGVLVATVPGPFCEEGLPMKADLWRNVGSAQEQRGDTESAIESYRRALAVYAEASEAHRRDAWAVHLNLGRLKANRGEIEEAVGHYREATALAPQEGEPAYNLGLLLAARGEVSEAARALEKAERLEPRLPRVQLHLARTLAAAGRPRDALVPARVAVQRAPEDAEAHFALGGLLLNLGRAEEAVEELRRAVELGATPQIRNELGTALIAVGRPQEAREQLEAAVAADPQYLDALTNLGALLAMTGRLPEARERLGRAVEIAPRDAVARFNLALVLQELGERGAAVEQLRRVLDLEPDHELARRRLEALEGSRSP